VKCSNMADLGEISRPWLRNTRPSFSLIDCISIGVDRTRYCGLVQHDRHGNNALAEIALPYHKNHRLLRRGCASNGAVGTLPSQ
jgi:hypothetical protein